MDQNGLRHILKKSKKHFSTSGRGVRMKKVSKGKAVKKSAVPVAKKQVKKTSLKAVKKAPPAKPAKTTAVFKKPVKSVVKKAVKAVKAVKTTLKKNPVKAVIKAVAKKVTIRKKAAKKVIAVKVETKKVAPVPAPAKPPVKQVKTAKATRPAVQVAIKEIVKTPAVSPIKTVSAKTPVKKAARVSVPVKKKITGSAKKAVIKDAESPESGKAFLPSARQVKYLRKKRSLSGPKYFFHNDIPAKYGETFVHAMQRDPDTMFVYWEIGENAINDLQTVLGHDAFSASKRVLRIIDITGSDANRTSVCATYDIEINDSANNWYITVPRGERTCIIEYGFITPQGRYHMVARSNTVSAVRGSVSDIIDDRWSSANTVSLITASKGKTAMFGASENLLAKTEEGKSAGSEQLPPAFFPGSSELNAPSSASFL
jgi:hypothetical protein